MRLIPHYATASSCRASWIDPKLSKHFPGSTLSNFIILDILTKRDKEMVENVKGPSTGNWYATKM